jgi:aspartate carbamoyltransferase catalytic subunit
MGSLFLEPSTRTRLSFEAAMARLGGRIITSSDPATSSAAKGETLSDTVRIVDSYVDLVVLRHPAAGAARWAARHAGGPVINAGDGAHEHPTQTLCDLYALRRERGKLNDLSVMLYGDLRYGRTTHSLARALVRMGCSIIAVAEDDLGLPDFVVHDLVRQPGCVARHVVVDDMEDVFRRRDVRAVAISSEDTAPAGGETEDDAQPFSLKDRSVDAIYVTRLQAERGAGAPRALPILDHRFLTSQPFKETIVLHPLPRVTEIAAEIDSDPRAAYFRQAALGVPIRMALLMWASGLYDLPLDITPPEEPEPVSGHRCENPSCITRHQGESVPEEVGRMPGDVPRCQWCEEEARPC